MTHGVPLVLHGHPCNVLFFDIIPCHIAVHLHGEEPNEVGIERAVQDRVPDMPEGCLRMGIGGTHLLLGDDQGHICHPGGHMPPPCDGRKDARTSSVEHPDVGFSRSGCAIQQVLTFLVYPVESVRSTSHNHHVDIALFDTCLLHGHL